MGEPDQRRVLVTADADGVVAVWDVGMRRLASVLQGSGPVELVAVVGPSLPGPIAVVGPEQVRFHVEPDAYDPEPCPPGRPTAVAVVPLDQDPRLAVGIAAGFICFLPGGEELYTEIPVTAVAPGLVDGQDVLVTGDEEGTVSLYWSPPRPEPVERFTVQAPVEAVGVWTPPDGPGLVVAGAGDRLYAWDPLSGEARDDLLTGDGASAEAPAKTESAVQMPAAPSASTATGPLPCTRLRGATGRVRGLCELRRIPSRPDGVRAWDVTDEESDPLVAVGGDDGSVQLYAGGRRAAAPLVHHQAPVVAVAFGWLDVFSPFLLEVKGSDRPAGQGTATGTPTGRAAAPGGAGPTEVGPGTGRVARLDPDHVARTKLVDHLGVRSEVDALCSVITSRDLDPPISIGLFGDWGSGKTFFMSLMRQQVARLAACARQAETRDEPTSYCAAVAQIEFNAWHFVDTNMWASIVTRIFEGLADYYQERAGDTVWDEVLQQAATVGERLATARDEQEAARRQKREATQAVAQAEARIREKEREIAQRQPEPRDLLQVALRDDGFRRRAEDAASQVGMAELPGSLGELEDQLRAARTLRGRLVRLWRSVGGPQASTAERAGISGALLALAALPAAFAWLVTSGLDDSARVVLAAASAWFTFAVERLTVVGGWLEAAHRGLDRLEEVRDVAYHQATAALTAERNELERELERREAELAERRRQLAEAEARVTQAETLRARLRSGEFMADLLRERAGQPGYAEELGIISLIRRDFDGLSTFLVPDGNGQQVPENKRLDRIILYVDDLDRCPSDRVVEVLQAVHLLLAFPLFVVVVGVDSRWLLHALSKHYSAFGAREGSRPGDDGRWTTTPHHYLEKIFQIPFTLRPMGVTGFENMIASLTTPRADAQAGTVPPAGEAQTGTSPPRQPAGQGGEADAPAEPAADIGVGQMPEAADQRPEAAEQMPEAAERRADAAKQMPVAPELASATPTEQPALSDGPEASASGADVPDADQDHLAGGGSQADLELAAIDPAPLQLELTRAERTLMSRLDELIPSPRVAKRLVNTYRLIKAMLPADRLARFEGDEQTPGEFQAVMLLLAMQSGFPSEAYEVFREIAREMRRRSVEPRWQTWWGLVEAMRPRHEEGTGWSSELLGPLTEADAERWTRLHDALLEQRPHVQVDDLAVYADHAGSVARFGFVTGRALAPDRKQEEDETGAPERP